jgi:hypothetical protein
VQVAVKAVVLVEGESDRIAIETLAARRGRDLAAEGVVVVAVGGAHALERALQMLEAERVAGLYDRGEEAAVRRALDRAAVTPHGFYACDPDLEGELVRSIGTERMLQLVVCGVGLHVFGHNAGARALYEALGYQPTNINMFKPL